MGVTDVALRFGFKYENPDKPYEMEGFVNSADAVEGLEFYKALYECCTPPGASNATWAKASTPSNPARSRCT